MACRPTHMSSNSATSLAQKITRHLGGNITRCDLVSDGINKIFEYSGELGQFYVRMVPETYRSFSDLEDELSIMHKLSVVGLPVCGVPRLKVPLVFGPISCESGNYNGLITSAVFGRQLGLTIAENEALARSLAKIHCVDHALTVNCSRKPINPSGQGPKRSAFREVATLIHEWADELKKAVRDPNVGFCHGDAWHGNAIFDGSEAILIDFEHHHIGPTSFDVATQVWWLNTACGDHGRDQICTFLEEYSKCCGNRISDAELRFQILRKELLNLHHLDWFELAPDIEAEITAQAYCTLQWVKQPKLLDC